MKSILLTIAILISLNTFSQKRFITIDSTRIWINTIGIEKRKEGQPVIVFESGYGTPMGHWNVIGQSSILPHMNF